MHKRDEFFMREALKQARLAARYDEVPIGAIVVSPFDEIIGKGYNRVERLGSQSRHAEVIALERASKARADWRLDGCTLYVTIEPCLMCIGLCGLSRIERVVYGAPSPLFGYSVQQDGHGAHQLKPLKNIVAGVLAEEAAGVMRQFFSRKRKVS